MPSLIQEPKPASARAEAVESADEPAAPPQGARNDVEAPVPRAHLSPQELLKRIESDPIIRRANELFGARIDHGDQQAK